MNIFRVSLFGHRRIDNLQPAEYKLDRLIRYLIKTKAYVSFLIGRNGDFDEYAASVIKRIQKEVGKDNNDIVLVLPYEVAECEYYEKYYDSVVIPDTVYGAHYKSSIMLRNRWMVEKADLVVVFVNHSGGGAYTAMRYAERMNKNIINIYE